MRTLFLWLLLGGLVAAQDVNVKFDTYPPGAQVYQFTDTGWNIIEDNPVTFSGEREIRFQFYYPDSASGGAPTQLGARASDFEDGKYKHTVVLQMSGGRWLAFFAWRWGWAVLLAVVALGGGVARLVRRRSALLGELPGAPAVRRMGRFVLGRSLGSGGFGEVYLSRNESGEEVAVKVLRPEMSQDEESKKRFFREIQVLCTLNHPNIIHIYDWGEHQGAVYLAMEYLEGETLSALLDRVGRLNPSQVSWILQQLTAALASLHERGLVHRDIKPDNVFLQGNGRLKLMDFGTALSADLTRATQTGMALGTPAYMAPEQLAGQLNPASDQYALGVLLFVCLTGRKPFEGLDAVSVAYAHAHQAPPRPSQIFPGLPLAVDEVVLRMLAKKPEQRFGSVLEAAEALELALSQPMEEGDEATRATSSDGTADNS